MSVVSNSSLGSVILNLLPLASKKTGFALPVNLSLAPSTLISTPMELIPPIIFCGPLRYIEEGLSVISPTA